MNNPFVVAVDFDGTIVREKPHDLDAALEMMPAASEVINWMYDIGCHIIIWTVRAELDEVKHFCKENDIKHHGINENAPFLDFQTSRKI